MAGIIGIIKNNESFYLHPFVFLFSSVFTALWMRFSGPDGAEQRDSWGAPHHPHWFHSGSHDGRLHGRGSVR